MEILGFVDVLPAATQCCDCQMLSGTGPRFALAANSGEDEDKEKEKERSHLMIQK